MLLSRRPAAPVSDYVEAIWYSSRPALPHRRERALPTGLADIVIPLLQDSVVRFDSVDALQPRHLRGAVVSGAHDRFVVRGMGGASSVIGVHFRPGGAAAFFGGSLPELCNQTVLLDALWGPAAIELRDRLLALRQPAQQIALVEDMLLARCRSATSDAMVQQALNRLARDPTVARIADVQLASGCSPQQFIRRFESVVGLGPKRYARVLRFNAMLGRLATAPAFDWAQLAVESGYGDQSHLIHEFQTLAGMTPTAYSPVHPAHPTHVAIGEPRAASGWAEKMPRRASGR